MESSTREYGFLTLLIPHQMEKSVAALSKGNMQDAANALQWHIYNGLCANQGSDIRIFNILPIGSFPQYYKNPFVRTSVFSTSKSTVNINIGFCNVKLLRKYIIPRRVYKALHHWCKKGHSPKTLFVYTITLPFMIALRKLKKKFPNLQICSIVADLPDMSCLTSRRSLLLKIFNKHQAERAYARLDCVDCFVLLSKHMADYMKIQQPYCVMEGISTQQDPIEEQQQDSLKRILYTGTLHRKFGILNLLEAFRQIEDDSYRLIICGIGDSENEIREAAQQDSRITYLGQLPRAEVLEWQAKATVLVNPRQNIEEYTKYSFPSKNLEYLSSGVPVVAYKLDGIPNEYDKYLNYPADNSPETLAIVLTSICNMTDSQRIKMGQAAQSFVLKNKNNVAQTKRILEFIKSMP